MTFEAEYTDTFSGEANYSWVRRVKFDAPENASDSALIRRAKNALSLHGMKGRKEQLGDCIAYYPSGFCTVLFITPAY